MNLEEFIDRRILNEYVVPMSYSLADWKKTGMTPKEYHQKHPDAKWKVVHGHAEPEKGDKVGDSIKSNLSYEKASKMHAAIAISQHG